MGCGNEKAKIVGGCFESILISKMIWGAMYNKIKKVELCNWIYLNIGQHKSSGLGTAFLQYGKKAVVCVASISTHCLSKVIDMVGKPISLVSCPVRQFRLLHEVGCSRDRGHLSRGTTNTLNLCLKLDLK